MKLTKEMIDRIQAWVELNGLYPQPCGATVQSLCQECGFSDESFRRWSQKVEFVEMLNQARAKFAATVEVKIVNALIRSAIGVDYTKNISEAVAQKVVEYDEKGKKRKEYTTATLVPKKAKQENIYYPPNVEAAKFVLSNINPASWRLKQEVTHTGGPTPINLEFSDPKALAGLNKALANGAQPRKPKDEEE